MDSRFSPPCEIAAPRSGRRPLISIAIPVLNEEETLDTLYARLDKLARAMHDRCELEFVFTDNASSDATWDKLGALAKQDARVRAMRFSKNFGLQRSVLANYMHARGDAVMQIDAGLQDPPELLEQFFDLWRQGYHVVYGVQRKPRQNTVINGFRQFAYRIADRLSDYPIAHDAGDCRLLDRAVLEAIKKHRSTTPYLRGLIASLGFRQIGVPYTRNARARKRKLRLGQRIGHSLSNVFNHSLMPLRIASYSGLILVGLTTIGTVYYIFLRLFHPELPRGLASIHILVLFGIGFQSLLLGILGEYLLRIYAILRAEPLAIVEQSLNFTCDELQL
jgi:glycosyltransferase involved in cell wall biosynthesis